MAEELLTDTDPFSEFGGKTVKQSADNPFSEFGGEPLKKKPSGSGSKSTSLPLVNGGGIDPVSLINTSNATAPLAPVVDVDARKKIQSDMVNSRINFSNSIRKPNRDNTLVYNSAVPIDNSEQSIKLAQKGADINKKASEEFAYYNPELRDVKTGDPSIDFLYNNQWLMDAPIVGNIIKNKAYDIAKQSHGDETISNADLRKIRQGNGKGDYRGQSLAEQDNKGAKNQINLLDQYFGKISLPKSKYTPTSDYMSFLPSVSIKGNFEKSGKKDLSNWIEFIQSMSAAFQGKDPKEIDYNKAPVYDQEGYDSPISESLGVNLNGHKLGVAWDKKKNLPYISVSDAWDFKPDDYSLKTGYTRFTDEKGKETGDRAYVQSSLMSKAGRAFKVYDRFYFDPKTKQYISDEDVAKGVKTSSPIPPQESEQSKQLKQYLSAYNNNLSPQDKKNFHKAIEIVGTRAPDRLTTPTKEEEEHQWIMDELDKTWQGKVVKAIGYLGSKASKGTLQIAKGVAHQAELSQNPLRFATGQDGATDGFFKKADELANFGLTKSDLAHIEQSDNMGSHAMSAAGTMAEMAPSIAIGSAVSAPEALFWLQGIGMGKGLTEDLKKQGKDLNPLAKEALIQGSGAVNMILSRIGDIYGKLPAIARGKIATGLAAEALQNVAGKELTSDIFKNELLTISKTFAQKLETVPLDILNKYNHTATTFAGLNAANYVMHKGVDAINDKPVFNETLGDLAENVYKSVTQEAPMFTVAGAVPEMTKLTPYSSYKNDVVESIARDPSTANVDALKAQIANHASEQNWTQQELSGSLQHIEQISAASKKLPSTVDPSKKEDAIGLIIDRDGLAKKLQQVKEGKQELDPAIADVPTAQEQYLTDKIEQANDKIRSIVTGKKVTYSKDETNPEKPKFIKTTDGKQENIEQSRYDLENTERQLKTISNEEQTATDSEKVLPEQPQANEARKQEANGDVPIEQGEQGGLVSANEVLDKPITYKGEPAVLFKDGQSLVVKINGSNREYELGNVDEIGNASIKELGIEHTKSVVDVGENGNITVRGKEVVNNFSDQKQAINYDKGGNVISVNLETPDGKKRTFKGDIAEDIAYQIHLNELNKNNESKQQFEQFVEQHEPSKSAIVARENEVIAEKGTTENNATVSRKPVKKIIKDEQSRPTTDNARAVDTVTKPVQQPKAKQAAKHQTEIKPDKSVALERPDVKPISPSGENGKIPKQSLSDAELQRKAELRKKFSGQLNDITRIPTLLANKEFREYSGLIFKEAAGDFKSFSKELIESVGEKIIEHLAQLHKELEKEYAVEAENKPTEPIGISREETRKQREMRGLEDLPDAEKKGLSDLFDLGRDFFDREKTNLDALAAEVAAKPKNLSPSEVGALLIRRQEIRSEIESVSTELHDAIKNSSLPESIETFSNRRRYLDNLLKLNEEGVRNGSRENSLALNALRNLIKADYTLATQRSRMMSIVHGELTPAMEAELEGYKRQLAEVTEQLEEHKRKAIEVEIKRTIEREKRQASKIETKEVLKAERKTIVADFRADLKKLRTSGALNSVGKAAGEFLMVAAPFMKKMLTNLAKEGIVEFKDVIKTIHEEFKDDIENLTERDVMDALSGKYNKRKQTKSELQDERTALIRLSVLTGRLDDLQNRLTKEKTEKGFAKKRGDIAKLELEIKEEQRKISFETKEERNKESLRNKLNKINERIKNGDFEKVEGKPKIELDPEAITIRAKVQKAQNNFDAMAERLQKHQQSKLEKSLSYTQQAIRFMLLCGVKTLGKLYSFATSRSITTPMEEVANSLNTRLPFFKRIAERSPRYSNGFDPKAESLAITTRISKATLKDSWVDVLKTGSGELDRLYGKHGVDKDFDLNPSALEFFGRLHGAFKNSTKRSEFFRSFQKRLQFYGEQGKDINDPNLQFTAAQQAYADGKRSILMGDNLLVDKGYKSLLRGLESGGDRGKVVAAVIRAMFPIVKIPTNFVLESVNVASGGLTGSIPGIYKALTKGIDSLTEREADVVMSSIAKGQIGVALMAYAYFHPQNFGGYYSGKRKDDDLKSGDIIIGGFHLPHWMGHNIYFEAMQIAATMRRAVDAANGNGAPSGIMDSLTTNKRDELVEMAKKASDKNNPDTQLVEVQDGKQLYQVYIRKGVASSIVKEGGVKQGLTTVGSGIIEQIPFSSLSSLMQSTSSPSTFIGSVAKNLIEPRFVQEAAEALDRKDGEAVKRDPQGLVEQLKSGIPVLRETVTEKEDKSIPKRIKEIRMDNGDVYILNKKQIEERQKINEEYLSEKEAKIRKLLSGKNLTEKDIQIRLQNKANKHSKIEMLKKYRVSRGKYNLEKSDE